MQNIRELALSAGAESRLAETLAHRYWQAYKEDIRPGYRSDDCRQGGAWDIHPASEDWP
jgi:hypothetical protein